jgi:hypothetical protein
VAYVVGIHEIDEPVPFWRAADPWVLIGQEVRLLCAYPLVSGAKAICLWEGETIERVHGFLDQLVGDFSSVELFEVDLVGAFGLPV